MPRRNLALRKKCGGTNSASLFFKKYAVDGKIGQSYVSSKRIRPWIGINLKEESEVSFIKIINRMTFPERLKNFTIKIGNDDDVESDNNRICEESGSKK